MRPGHKADHSTPSTAVVKNEWSYTCTPHPYAFMACIGTNLRLCISHCVNDHNWTAPQDMNILVAGITGKTWGYALVNGMWTMMSSSTRMRNMTYLQSTSTPSSTPELCITTSPSCDLHSPQTPFAVPTSPLPVYLTPILTTQGPGAGQLDGVKTHSGSTANIRIYWRFVLFCI